MSLKSVSLILTPSLAKTTLTTFRFGWQLDTVGVFPNAFDKRLNTDNGKRIRRALKKVHAQLDALLYSISSELELDDSTPYRLRVVMLAKPYALSQDGDRALLETAKDEIEAILTSRSGIVLESVSIASTGKMTVEQYRTFSSWGFEDVSLEGDSDLPP
jgi:hypothetical protein